MKVYGEYLLIKPIKEYREGTDIEINAETIKSKGEILEVGDKVSLDLNKNDKVLYLSFAGMQVDEYFVVKQQDIVAKL
jgi:co-chaperonin GroES (HSP10)